MSSYYLLYPVVSITVTAVIFAIFLILTTPVDLGSRERISAVATVTFRAEKLFRLIAGSAILAAFIVASLPIATSTWRPDEHYWYQHPLPSALASLALISLTIALHAARATPDAPTLTIERRTWRSFSTRIDVRLLLGGALATVLVCALSLVAFRWMSIPGPNGDPVDFFGRSYSIPVLLGTVLVTSLWALTLNTNAAPPFSHPESVGAESRARKALASAISRISIAAIALTLGSSLSSVGAALSGQGEFGFGDFLFNLGLGSVGGFVIVLGRWAQILGVVLLLLALAGGMRAPRFGRRRVGLVTTEESS